VHRSIIVESENQRFKPEKQGMGDFATVSGDISASVYQFVDILALAYQLLTRNQTNRNKVLPQLL
jgi:hypothetical protein